MKKINLILIIASITTLLAFSGSYLFLSKNVARIEKQSYLKFIALHQYFPNGARIEAINLINDNTLKLKIFKEHYDSELGRAALDAIDSDVPIVNCLILEKGADYYGLDRITQILIEEIENQNRLAYIFTQVASNDIAELVIRKIDDEKLLFDIMNITFINEGKVILTKKRLSELL